MINLRLNIVFIFSLFFATVITAQEFQLNNYFNKSLTQEQRQEIYSQISQYSKAIRDNPEETSNYINRGVCYAKLGQYPDAISDYNIALKIDSMIPEAYYNRGIARGRFRYTKGACMDLRRASKLGLNLSKEIFDKKCSIYKNSLSPN